MKAVLVIILFTMNPDGSMTQRGYDTVPVSTLEECNEIGRNFRSVVSLPEEVKSITVCVMKEDFNA